MRTHNDGVLVMPVARVYLFEVAVVVDSTRLVEVPEAAVMERVTVCVKTDVCILTLVTVL